MPSQVLCSVLLFSCSQAASIATVGYSVANDAPRLDVTSLGPTTEPALDKRLTISDPDDPNFLYIHGVTKPCGSPKNRADHVRCLSNQLETVDFYVECTVLDLFGPPRLFPPVERIAGKCPVGTICQQHRLLFDSPVHLPPGYSDRIVCVSWKDWHEHWSEAAWRQRQRRDRDRSGGGGAGGAAGTSGGRGFAAGAGAGSKRKFGTEHGFGSFADFQPASGVDKRRRYATFKYDGVKLEDASFALQLLDAAGEPVRLSAAAADITVDLDGQAICHSTANIKLPDDVAPSSVERPVCTVADDEAQGLIFHDRDAITISLMISSEFSAASTDDLLAAWSVLGLTKA